MANGWLSRSRPLLVPSTDAVTSSSLSCPEKWFPMSIRHTRVLRRVLVPASATAVLVAVSAVPATAHVRVSSPDAAPGGFGKLVFRVPTESDTASTTKLTVTMPRSTPFAFVSSRPLPGWTVSTTQRRLSTPLKVEGFTLTKVVATVTWTAGRGAGIKPGEFDEFELSVGPFPKAGSTVSMPAAQGYSDGTTVTWDQPSKPGQPEPEHPVPALDLAKAPATATAGDADDPSDPSDPSDSDGSDSSAASDGKSAATARQAGTGSSTDTVGRWLGGGGLLLGASALVVALARTRRPSRTAREPR